MRSHQHKTIYLKTHDMSKNVQNHFIVENKIKVWKPTISLHSTTFQVVKMILTPFNAVSEGQ